MAYSYDEYDNIIFKDFNKKLKKIMEEQGINAHKIAVKTGVLVYYYFNQGKTPTAGAIEKLAELFDVQVDYFISPWAQRLDTPERTFALRLRTLMFYYGYNITDLGRKTDICTETLRRIMSGEFSGVSVRHLVKLGQFFGVSIDYLLGLKDSLD